jgi:Xaa-Pro aminopeptidase
MQAATSELIVRDAGDLLDPMRMIIDSFGLKNLKRAIEITGQGLMEGMKTAEPGLTTLQVMHTVDYVYRLNGADLGFLTGVSPSSNMNEEIKWETTAEEEAARKGDESYTYGIGHFIGMEVHEHGNYVGPLMPGMVIAIEQGAVVNGTRVAFEDDVLVTKNGHEWLTRFIPIEIDEVEALLEEEKLLRPTAVLDVE